MERGELQSEALATQQRNAVTRRHSSTQTAAAVSFVQNGKDQGESAMIVVLSDPDGENHIAAESDCSSTAARLDASDSDSEGARSCSRKLRRTSRRTPQREMSSHIIMSCAGTAPLNTWIRRPVDGYADSCG